MMRCWIALPKRTAQLSAVTRIRKDRDNVLDFQQMISRLDAVRTTLEWIAAECKKPPTIDRVLEVLQAAKATDDALPIIENAKRLGLVKEAHELRLSLTGVLLNGLNAGQILAGMRLGIDTELIQSDAESKLKTLWEPRLEALYADVNAMQAAIGSADFQGAWDIGATMFPQ